MTNKITMANYMDVAGAFDNHESAHLLDAYIAGLGAETLEFVHEVRNAMRHRSEYFDSEKFNAEAGDMLWNMTVFFNWFGHYSYVAQHEFNNDSENDRCRSMDVHDLAELIVANLGKMLNTRERMLRIGSTTDLTTELKMCVMRMFYAWRELCFRYGFPADVVADDNVKKLCKRYGRDYAEIVALGSDN